MAESTGGLPTRDWKPKSAVVLVNLGTPTAPTAAAVGRFLAEFLSDRRVVELPAPLWQPILRGIVIPLRSRRVAEAYQSIWDGDSPLRRISIAQQAALQSALRAECGDDAPVVHLAMTYQGPALSGVLDELLASGVERVCILPLYPQYSATTTGAVYDQIARFALSRRRLPHLQLVRDYHDHPFYIRALSASVREHWSRNGRAGHLLMSFHGIPEANVRKGDPYAEQCARTAGLLAQELELHREQWSFSYQSRFGKAKWLEPYTNEALVKLAMEGKSELDVICPAFSVDCLETLEEMAVENKQVFLDNGGKTYRYIECLNDRRDHVAMMLSVLRDAGFIHQHL